MKNEIGFFKKAEIPLKLAIRNKPSFSLQVAREQISLFAYGFVNEVLSKTHLKFTLLMAFFYMVFSDEISRMGF